MDFLLRLHDIKDTVHKQSLLHHVASLVIEQFEESTDLHSELSHVHHSAKVSILLWFCPIFCVICWLVNQIDVENLVGRIKQLEEDATVSWDRLRAIAKHESSQDLKLQLVNQSVNAVLLNIHYHLLFCLLEWLISLLMWLRGSMY